MPINLYAYWRLSCVHTHIKLALWCCSPEYDIQRNSLKYNIECQILAFKPSEGSLATVECSNSEESVVLMWKLNEVNVSQNLSATNGETKR